MFFFLDPVVELFQVVQAFHVPRHVVQAHLPPFAAKERRPPTSINAISWETSRSADMKADEPGFEYVRVQAQQLLIPVLRTFPRLRTYTFIWPRVFGL